jgi:hypothetical protein
MQENTNKPNNGKKNTNNEDNLEQNDKNLPHKNDFIAIIVFVLYFWLPFIYGLFLRFEVKKIAFLIIYGLIMTLWLVALPLIYNRKNNRSYSDKIWQPYPYDVGTVNYWIITFVPYNLALLIYMWYFKSI